MQYETMQEAVGRPSLRLAWRAMFLDACAALCADDVATAHPLFERLEAMFPKNMEIRLHAAWARARLAQVSSEADYVELERLARWALGSGASTALPLCVLGHVAARRGELRTALRLFVRSANAGPSLVDARRGAMRLQRRLGRGIAKGAR